MLSTSAQPSDASGAETSVDQALDMRPASRGRVLVIEQDRSLLEQYADLLLGEGYQISAARSPAIAARLLHDRGTLFDAVLSEATAPSDSAALRAAREVGPGIPVVVVTGKPSVETAVEALELGALHYLVRPFASAELLRCVEHAARLRRLDPANHERLACLGQAEAPGEERDQLEVRLTRALQSLYMTYQPIVRTRDGMVFGWEALLRTKEPTVGGPLSFLALAERLGRTRELGRSIRTSVAGVAGKTRGAMFFVNLHHDDLLDEHLYDPGSPLSDRASEVVLEVTERRPIESVPDVRERVARLRKLGFRIAIDDFGAGYSGLTSLTLLGPDFVKLDRGLVAGLDRQQAKRRLVASLVGMCRDLGHWVVAEGVETAAEQSVLAEMGCDLMQGFFFRAPEELGFDGQFALAANG